MEIGRSHCSLLLGKGSCVGELCFGNAGSCEEGTGVQPEKVCNSGACATKGHLL